MGKRFNNCKISLMELMDELDKDEQKTEKKGRITIDFDKPMNLMKEPFLKTGAPGLCGEAIPKEEREK